MLTPDRDKEIRSWLEKGGDLRNVVTFIGEVLAEIDRLRGQLAFNIGRNGKWHSDSRYKDLEKERDAFKAAVTARTTELAIANEENKKLSERIEKLRKALEWPCQHGDTCILHPCYAKRRANEAIENDDKLAGGG